MQYLLSLLPLLACPLGMGVMMWFMMRGPKESSPRAMEPSRQELEQSRTEGCAMGCASPAEATSDAKQPTKSSPMFSLFGMCLDWRVIAGLAVVGVGIWVIAPRFILGAIPLLLLAICPLSMLLMMGQMGKMRQPSSDQQAQGDQFSETTVMHDEQLCQMQGRLAAVQREQEHLTQQIALAERQQPEVAASEAHAMEYAPSYEFQQKDAVR